MVRADDVSFTSALVQTRFEICLREQRLMVGLHGHCPILRVDLFSDGVQRGVDRAAERLTQGFEVQIEGRLDRAVGANYCIVRVPQDCRRLLSGLGPGFVAWCICQHLCVDRFIFLAFGRCKTAQRYPLIACLHREQIFGRVRAIPIVCRFRPTRERPLTLGQQIRLSAEAFASMHL